jgi:hypothetical protein
MRSYYTAAALAGLMVLSACAAQQQTRATAPTVTYEYGDDDEYDVIAAKADLYCEEEYGLDADLVDRATDGDDYEAVFACK